MKTFNKSTPVLLASLTVLIGGLAFQPPPARAQRSATTAFGSVWSYQNKHIVVFGGGWSARSGWLSDEGARTVVFAGTKFDVYATDAQRLGALTVDRPTANEDGRMASARNSLNNVGELERLALTGIERPFPRPTRVQNLKNATYEKAVAEFLRGRGAKVSRARLTQLWRVDLNGDKVDEVLFTAQTHAMTGPGSLAKSTDYAVSGVSFLDPKSGRVKIVPLEIRVNPKVAEDETTYRCQLLGCPDLNGDGKQEIVVSYGYYEGSGLSAWTFDGRGVKKVCDVGGGL